MNIKISVGYVGSFYPEDFDEPIVCETTEDFKDKLDRIFNMCRVDKVEITNNQIYIYIEE